jgi:hypothetical protein
MDITPELTQIVQRCMDAKYESRAEFARAAGVAKSMVTRLLAPQVEGLWLTEAVWDRIYDALLPEISREAGPEYLPRSRWMAYISSVANGNPTGNRAAPPVADPLLSELSGLWEEMDRGDRLALLSYAHRLRKEDAPPSP